MKASLRQTVVSVVFAYAVGMGLLLLLSAIALFLPYPSEGIPIVGLLSSSLGAFFLGILEKRKNATVTESLLSGVLYTLVPLAVSFFGKGSFFTFPVRGLMLCLFLTLVVLPGICFRSKKKRRRKVRR